MAPRYQVEKAWTTTIIMKYDQVKGQTSGMCAGTGTYCSNMLVGYKKITDLQEGKASEGQT